MKVELTADELDTLHDALGWALSEGQLTKRYRQEMEDLRAALADKAVRAHESERINKIIGPFGSPRPVT